MQHMLRIGPNGTGGAMLLPGLTDSGLGIAIQTVCPILLVAGLFSRLAALALLVQLLVLQAPGQHDVALFWAALLGWTVVMGAGPFSLDRMFRPGIDASALPPSSPLGRPCRRRSHPPRRPGLSGGTAAMDRGSSRRPGARGVRHFEPDGTGQLGSGMAAAGPGHDRRLASDPCSRAGGGIGRGAVHAKRRTAAHTACADQPRRARPSR